MYQWQGCMECTLHGYYLNDKWNENPSVLFAGMKGF